MAIWKEIMSSNVAGLKLAAQELGIHSLVLEDCINRNQRAKLEDFDTHQFLVWFMVAKDVVYELQFIIFANQVIFVPHEPPPESQCWSDYFKINPSAKDVWHMVYQALDKAADVTINEIRIISTEIYEFENKVFTAQFKPRAILNLKRKLNNLEYAIEHLPSVAKQLQNFYRVKDDLTWKWRDLHDHCERAFSNVTRSGAQIGATIELYWGHQADKTNRQVKQLSMLASITVPLTFWASFWGMNFESIPFSSPTFFAAALFVMGGSAVLAVWLLIRKGYWND